MRTRRPLFRILTFLILIATSSASFGQAYIPDEKMRDWLNTAIPGIVDASGIMDTIHPGIASLDTMVMYHTSLFETFDLEGIQYLDSLKYFAGVITNLDEAYSVTFSRAPQALVNFELHCYYPSFTDLSSSITLPHFPETLRGLDIMAEPSASLTIDGLPNEIELLHLNGCQPIEWGPPVSVHTIIIDDGQLLDSPPPDLVIPPIHASIVNISEIWVNDLDLSLMEADTVYVTTPNYSAVEGIVLWPQNMIYLFLISFPGLTDLGELPESIEELAIQGTSLTCLPHLPNAIRTLGLWSSTIRCLPNIPDSLDWYECTSCSDSEGNIRLCNVLTSDCPSSNPGIGGRVFVDVNGDGMYTPDEPSLPQARVQVQPNGSITGCDGTGSWVIGVLPGEYTVAPMSDYPYVSMITPASHLASVPNYGDADTLNDFAVQLIPNITDLRAWLWAEPARPGFDNRLYLTCQNYGTIPLDAELTLNFDGDQTWVGSSIAPASSTASSATWNFPAMAIGASATLTVDLNTATSVALGTPIEHLLAASSSQSDETPNDNTYLFSDSVVGSYDPNDKLLNPAVLSPAQVQAGETPIEYTIRFQNTGTYLAERVVILDTLSEDLQWASLRFLDSSHPNHWYVVDGVLHVIHNDINLPDSTSDEANSHGFVRFSILPSTDLADGASITNIAHIVFDFNAPIITPPAVFSVDVTASVTDLESSSFSIYPNPVRDRLWITIPDAQKTINYRINDMLGKVVLSGASANGVDVQELATGLYTLTLDQAGVRESVRFVKD